MHVLGVVVANHTNKVDPLGGLLLDGIHDAGGGAVEAGVA